VSGQTTDLSQRMSSARGMHLHLTRAQLVQALRLWFRGAAEAGVSPGSTSMSVAKHLQTRLILTAVAQTCKLCLPTIEGVK